MPKPNGAKEKAKEITDVRYAWSVGGSAIADFLPENELGGEAYRSLQTLVDANKYGTGREQLGAFLCMCMLGQTDSKGNRLYNIKDIVTPGRLVAEKKALCSKLINLMTPVVEDDEKNEKETSENIKEIDAFFQKGVERSCNYARGVMGNGILAGNISEIISTEAATVSHLATVIFNNNVKSSYERGILIENTPVHRLKAAGFDVERVYKSHGGMIDMIATTSQNLENMVNYVENGVKGMYFIHALANYIMFDSALERSKDHSTLGVIPSLTGRDYIEKVKSGEHTIVEKVTDFSPLEYSIDIVEKYMNLVPTSEIDDLIEDGSIDNLFETHLDDAKLQRKRDFVEAYRPYVENIDDDVYRYGIGAMYLNGNLFKNLKYSADPYIDNKKQDGTMASTSYVAYGNISINFEETLKRENVLREAYLSDLDAGEFHYEPVAEGENGADIPAVNQARTEELRQLKQSIDALEPTWHSSPEWKNMKTALEKAISVSERFQNNYGALQNGDEPVAAKKALEELNSAMEMVQTAARNYVEHKVEKVDFEEGPDFNRLKAAKKLENFSRNQGNYLTAKLADEVMNTLDLGAEKHIESVNSDAAVIDRLYRELDSVYQETHFHSTELDELKDSLDNLRFVQSDITRKGKIDPEDNRRYYGVTTPDGHTEGAIERVIEKAQKYIDHRIKEGLSSDRYSKRVDMAMRIRNYLEAVQDNADRAQNKRLENYRNIDAKLDNHKAFNAQYADKKSDLMEMCAKIKGEKIPADSINTVKDSLYFMLAHQKYINDRALISSGKMEADKSDIVRLVETGDFKGAIKFMKANVDAKEFVDSHSETVKAVRKYSTDKECSNALRIVESRAAKRKTVAECIESAGKITDGKMDKALMAKYIVCRSLLEIKKAKDAVPMRTADEIERTKNSKELEAIIERYKDTKNFATKMDAMYFDYAQLAVYTQQHENKMPEDITKFFEDIKAKKIELVNGNNQPDNANKPQVDAKEDAKIDEKKPEEVKQIQEVVKTQ